MLLLSELMQESLMLHCRQFFHALLGACKNLWQSLLLCCFRKQHVPCFLHVWLPA